MLVFKERNEWEPQASRRPSANMSGYATLRPSGENIADVNLNKRTRVTTISYPCGKNERGGARETKERRCVWSVEGRSEGNWEEKKLFYSEYLACQYIPLRPKKSVKGRPFGASSELD